MITVLVADDHPMFREALASTLRSLDDHVDVIESGSLGEAVHQISTGADIDLILLDLRMPGMNGVKGVRSLRMRRPDVPVDVISALADDFVMRECFDAGATGYIPKFLSRTAYVNALSIIQAVGRQTHGEQVEKMGDRRQSA